MQVLGNRWMDIYYKLNIFIYAYIKKNIQNNLMKVIRCICICIIIISFLMITLVSCHFGRGGRWGTDKYNPPLLVSERGTEKQQTVRGKCVGTACPGCHSHTLWHFPLANLWMPLMCLSLWLFVQVTGSNLSWWLMHCTICFQQHQVHIPN